MLKDPLEIMTTRVGLAILVAGALLFSLSACSKTGTAVKDFDAGKEFTVFQLSNHHAKVAPLICFEDTIGELTRQFVLRGADFFANVTNDGWFLRSAGSRQHLANAIFRCVENRRPMVRAANTGISGIVDPYGRVVEQTPIFQPAVLVGEARYLRTSTFYSRHGDILAYGSALATAALVLLARRVK